MQGRRRLAVASQHHCRTWRGRRGNGQNWRGLLCKEGCFKRSWRAFSRAEAGGESSSFLLPSDLTGQMEVKLRPRGQSTEVSPRAQKSPGGKQKSPAHKHPQRKSQLLELTLLWMSQKETTQERDQKRQIMAGVGEDIGNQSTHTLLVGTAVILGDSLTFPQNVKHGGAIWYSNFTPGYIAKGTIRICSCKKLHANVQSSIIYNSQKAEITQMSVSLMNG